MAVNLRPPKFMFDPRHYVPSRGGGMSILKGAASDSGKFPRLQIDDFTFRVNPREQIEGDDSAALAMHDPSGTGPRYEDMGEGEHTISFSGQFRDDHLGTAWDQYQGLRLLKGAPRMLQYGRIRAKVWIEQLRWTLRRSDRINYAMTLRIDFSGKRKRAPVHAPYLPEETTDGGGIGPSLKAPPAADEPYQVKENDTWESISTDLFQTPDYADVLRGMNPQTEEDGRMVLLPGTSLVVPSSPENAEEWKKHLEAKMKAAKPEEE